MARHKKEEVEGDVAEKDLPTVAVCPNCSGSGKSAEDECSNCEGKGTL